MKMQRAHHKAMGYHLEHGMPENYIENARLMPLQ